MGVRQKQIVANLTVSLLLWIIMVIVAGVTLTSAIARWFWVWRESAQGKEVTPPTFL
jgi:hypothetical protein